MFSYTVGFFLFFQFIFICGNPNRFKWFESQYYPISISSDIKYIHNAPKRRHNPSSWLIRALNCGSLLPSPQPSATLLPSISVILIISKYVSWAFMMSYKMPHCVYVQVSKETRNQLIGNHFIRIVLLHWQREPVGEGRQYCGWNNSVGSYLEGLINPVVLSVDINSSQ